jgi:hypothetical protein
MKVKFLLDENLSPRLKLAVVRLEPEIDIIRIGDYSAPALGTLDPDVLVYLQHSQRLLITDNRTSMPDHLEEHWKQGFKIWGLFWLRPNTNLGTVAQFLHLIWHTTDAEEWCDRLDWIPF